MGKKAVFLLRQTLNKYLARSYVLLSRIISQPRICGKISDSDFCIDVGAVCCNVASHQLDLSANRFKVTLCRPAQV